MPKQELLCWRCGSSLKDIQRPIVRLAQCKQCQADLHVCRLCRFYNPGTSGRCDHDMAEPAREVDLANFCDYYRPSNTAFAEDVHSKNQKALDQLNALFKDSDTTKEDKPATAPKAEDDKLSDYDKAKKRFDDLFK